MYLCKLAALVSGRCGPKIGGVRPMLPSRANRGAAQDSIWQARPGRASVRAKPSMDIQPPSLTGPISSRPACPWRECRTRTILNSRRARPVPAGPAASPLHAGNRSFRLRDASQVKSYLRLEFFLCLVLRDLNFNA